MPSFVAVAFSLNSIGSLALDCRQTVIAATTATVTVAERPDSTPTRAAESAVVVDEAENGLHSSLCLVLRLLLSQTGCNPYSSVSLWSLTAWSPLFLPSCALHALPFAASTHQDIRSVSMHAAFSLLRALYSIYGLRTSRIAAATFRRDHLLVPDYSDLVAACFDIAALYVQVVVLVECLAWNVLFVTYSRSSVYVCLADATSFGTAVLVVQAAVLAEYHAWSAPSTGEWTSKGSYYHLSAGMATPMGLDQPISVDEAWCYTCFRYLKSAQLAGCLTHAAGRLLTCHWIHLVRRSFGRCGS